MEAKHTETPWRATGVTGSAMHSYAQPHGVAKDGAALLICGCFGDLEGGAETAQANVDFIVRACNAHDELVKALRGLLDCAGEDLSNASDEVLLRGVGDGPDDLTKEQAQAFLNARAALAKAGATP